MNAYAVVLQLFEKEEGDDDAAEDHGSKIRIITVASSLSAASEYAKQAYEKADHTEGSFYWEVVHAEKIEGNVALPAMRAIIPKI